MREDIRTHLALQAPYEVTASFDRPNLYLPPAVPLPSEKPSVLLELVLQEGENAASSIAAPPARWTIPPVFCRAGASGQPLTTQSWSRRCAAKTRTIFCMTVCR